MARFAVSVTETNTALVFVEANNAEEAEALAADQCVENPGGIDWRCERDCAAQLAQE